MRTKSAARKEYIVFMNNDTLLYWHKLENFYPYILEEQHNEKIKSFKIARECDYPDLENPTIQDVFEECNDRKLKKCIWEFLG